MSKFILLVNPASGNRSGPSIAKKVEQIFKRADIELTTIITQYPDHARNLSRTLPFYDYNGLCAVGGDGTIHEVINGMMMRPDGRTLPIGIIPAGTGNSMIHDLGNPDPITAAKVIARQNSDLIDIVKINMLNDVLFGFNVISWGVPVSISELAENLRWARGQRYNLAALIEIMRNEKRWARLSFNEEVHEGNFGFVVACNTIHVGNGMKMAPRAIFNDGLIDLLFIKEITQLKLLSLFTKVFKGSHVDDPIVSYRQVRSFKLECKGRQSLNVDGQTTGSAPFSLEVLPRAMSIFT